MTEKPGIPQDADLMSEGEPVPGRQVRRWAAPIGVVVVVVAVVVGVRLMADGREGGPPARHGTGSHWPARMPRFMLTVGSTGDLAPKGPALGAREPWLQVHEIEKNGRERLVDSVRSPSPSTGGAQEIIAGPGGMFVVAASRAKPCESRLYRFRLTADGHATGITPINGGITQSLVAGLAISPDGRRIAYATAPCPDARPASLHGMPSAAAYPPLAADPPSAMLTVLDLTTGSRRTWTAAGTMVIGEIVWARDGHTLGYTTGGLIHRTPTSPPSSPDGNGGPSGDTTGDVTVHALDTEAPGADLLAGRVLFRQPGGPGTVTTAVMNPDGRTGYGMMQKGQPPSTIFFSFTGGRPMHVTHTITPDPKGGTAIALSSAGEGPRYACLNGIDAFGRVIGGTFMAGSPGMGRCGAATAY
jgi:hypothetical protein